MTELDSLRDARDRLDAGEPIRILIGHVMHRSIEIEPAASFMAGLRAAFLCDIDEAIATLTPSPDPAAPAGALPPQDERTA